MKNTIRFRVWLEREIRARRMTQLEFSRAIGTHPSNVSRWISGQSDISDERVPVIARVLGVPERMIALLGTSDDDEALERARENLSRELAALSEWLASSTVDVRERIFSYAYSLGYDARQRDQKTYTRLDTSQRK